jgi:hypothetical protein
MRGRIFLLSTAGLTSTILIAANPRAVSLCDLPQLGNQLEGRIIRISGVLRNTDARDNPSFDELTEECRGRLVRIQIVSPDSHFLDNPPAGYKPDTGSVRRAEPVFQKAAAEGRSVYATVEGVFYPASTQPPGPVRHRQYPAYIVIQAFRNVKEIDEPPK